MRNVRAVSFGLGCFLAGIAFVIACDDEVLDLIDAGSAADAANEECDCTGYELAITSSRTYRVRNASEQQGSSQVGNEASCEDGDTLLGGGCWIYKYGYEYEGGEPDNAQAEHNLLISGPMRFIDDDGVETGRKERWVCFYENEEGRDNLVVEATAFCFHPSTDE